jgi:ribosomal-protein-alanine N-acetyltransferase
MQIKIRPLIYSDLDEVMQIEPIAFGVHHWSRQSFVNELNNSCGEYFAAVGSSKLVGYSGFWLIGEEAHITTLAVHPDERRRYIGERLLIHDIERAEKAGARWLTLEVRVSNQSAQELYFKYGFKSLGLRRHYYQDNGEDALVLWTDNITSPQFKELIAERTKSLQQAIESLAQTPDAFISTNCAPDLLAHQFVSGGHAKPKQQCEGTAADSSESK